MAGGARVLGLAITAGDGHRWPISVVSRLTECPSCRGDWTPLEFFIAGLRGWKAGLRRFVRLPDGRRP